MPGSSSTTGRIFLDNGPRTARRCLRLTPFRGRNAAIRAHQDASRIGLFELHLTGNVLLWKFGGSISVPIGPSSPERSTAFFATLLLVPVPSCNRCTCARLDGPNPILDSVYSIPSAGTSAARVSSKDHSRSCHAAALGRTGQAPNIRRGTGHGLVKDAAKAGTPGSAQPIRSLYVAGGHAIRGYV